MAEVISDTGPLNYLILIDAVEFLPRLFDRLIIPEQVLAELNHERTPPIVRTWLADQPPWIEIEAVRAVEMERLDKLDGRLGAGELSAMAVALTKGLPILIDDRLARQTADGLGIATFGTLAILEAAADRGWIEFRTEAQRLRECGFYVTDAVIDAIAERLADKS